MNSLKVMRLVHRFYYTTFNLTFILLLSMFLVYLMRLRMTSLISKFTGSEPWPLQVAVSTDQVPREPRRLELGRTVQQSLAPIRVANHSGVQAFSRFVKSTTGTQLGRWQLMLLRIFVFACMSLACWLPRFPVGWQCHLHLKPQTFVVILELDECCKAGRGETTV